MEDYNDFIDTFCQNTMFKKETIVKALELNLLSINKFSNGIYQLTSTDKTLKFMAEIDEKVRNLNSEGLLNFIQTIENDISILLHSVNHMFLFTTDDMETFKKNVKSKFNFIGDSFLIYRRLGKYNVAVQKPWWFDNICQMCLLQNGTHMTISHNYNQQDFLKN